MVGAKCTETYSRRIRGENIEIQPKIAILVPGGSKLTVGFSWHIKSNVRNSTDLMVLDFG